MLPATSLPLDLNNFGTTGTRYPDPDTNITYPDFNNPFLAVDTLVPNGTENPVRVITPSFHRPFLLRNAAANGGGTVTPYTWYTDKNTAAMVLFPHREHLAVNSAGKLPANTSGLYTQRFVSALYPDQTLPVASQLKPFPIPGDALTWQANFLYGLGARVQPNPVNQHIYVATAIGTSGGSRPLSPRRPVRR